jgi:hypothetical protein
MGLDMYLTKKTYVWTDHETGKRELKSIKGFPEKYKNIKPERIKTIEEEVGYWRKANQIHKWLVDNIQDGNDDCGEYSLPKEKAIELLNICKEIKEKCKLVEGKVRNGQVSSAETGGKLVDVMEDGKLITNSHIAAKLLPSESGFFFGSTDYDQYYMDDIDNTIEILEKVLAEEDPEKDYFKEEIIYQSSW